MFVKDNDEYNRDLCYPCPATCVRTLPTRCIVACPCPAHSLSPTIKFQINRAKFANDVTQQFACSASSSADTGKHAALKKGNMEVTVQRHWLEELTALLYAKERLTSHSRAKNSPYYIPKGLIESTVKKGLPKKKKK